jgi:hypothetical protein
MLEIYINPLFSKEAHEWKVRFKNFNFTQILSPSEFKMVNERNEIKLGNNRYIKDFNLIAN